MSNEYVIPEMKCFKVTCRGEGCENLDIGIELQLIGLDAFVICGPCGQQITDITPTTTSK